MHPMGVKPLKKISRRWGMQGRRCLGPPRHAGTLAPYRPRRPVAVAPRPPPWGGLPPRQRHSPAFRGARSFAWDRLTCPSWNRSPRRPRRPSPLSPSLLPRHGAVSPVHGRAPVCLACMEWNGMGQGEPRRRGPPRPVDVRLRGHGPRPSLATVSPPTQGRLAWSCLRSPPPRGPSPHGLGLRSHLRIHLFSRSGGFLWTFLVRLDSHLRSAVFSGSGRTAPFKRRPLLPIQVEKKSRNCTGNRHRWVGSIC
jgi:hypothetical protein